MEKRGVLGSVPVPDPEPRQTTAPEAKPPVKEKTPNELPASK